MKIHLLLPIITCSMFTYSSCKSNDKVTEVRHNEEIPQTEMKIEVDNFEGKWVDISDPNYTINIVKKYDNVYYMGNLRFDRDYTNDGRECITEKGNSEGKMQYIFDNHTQHLLSRIIITQYNIISDDREFQKAN